MNFLYQNRYKKMPTSKKRTKNSTLEINFDHVDRRNCYIEAEKLGYEDYTNVNMRYSGRRDTLAKYNVPRRYRRSFWKGWRAGWSAAADDADRLYLIKKIALGRFARAPSPPTIARNAACQS